MVIRLFEVVRVTVGHIDDPCSEGVVGKRCRRPIEVAGLCIGEFLVIQPRGGIKLSIVDKASQFFGVRQAPVVKETAG